MRIASHRVRRVAVLLSLISVCLGAAQYSVAADFAMVDQQGRPASLDVLREDGKWTVFMLRFQGCGSCDSAEGALAKWYERQDKSQVSVSVLNLDGVDEHGRVHVKERPSVNSGDYPRFFTLDDAQASVRFSEISGKVLSGVPSWLLFGPDGSFISAEVGPQFDWGTVDEMIRFESSAGAVVKTSSSTVQPRIAASSVKERSPEDVRSDQVVNYVIDVLVRGDMFRVDAWLSAALEQNPDHAGLLSEWVRYLMLDKRVPADTPLGYRFSADTDKAIQTALDTALGAEPTHAKALYLQAELDITQGRLADAEQTIQLADQLSINARYRVYIKGLLLIMQGRSAEAVKSFDRLLYAKYSGPDQTFLYQQVWEQVKSLAIKHPEVDPLPLAREGLVERVAGKDMLAVVQQRSQSETPLLIIATSEDPYCSLCAGNGKDIETFVRRNQGKYHFVYTSVEPWRNISYQPWAYVIPRVTGLPSAIVFARSQYMATTELPISPRQMAWYDKTYPSLLTHDPGTLDYTKAQAKAESNIAFRYWRKVRGPVSAYASTGGDGKYAWGSSSNHRLTQEQADRKALDVCQEQAQEKGINEPCRLYTETMQ